MRTPKIGLLHCGSSPQLRTLADPALQLYQIQSLYMPETEPAQLGQYDVILVADRLHAGQRGRFEAAVRELLEDASKIVIVLGENETEKWLPSLGYTFRPTVFWKWRTGEDNGTRLRRPEDDFWSFYSARATDWHHHGLLHPPRNARSYVVMEEQGQEIGSILYVDDSSQPALLLATTMDPVYHHGSGFMPGATQLLYSLMRWATAMHLQRAGLVSV